MCKLRCHLTRQPEKSPHIILYTILFPTRESKQATARTIWSTNWSSYLPEACQIETCQQHCRLVAYPIISHYIHQPQAECSIADSKLLTCQIHCLTDPCTYTSTIRFIDQERVGARRGSDEGIWQPEALNPKTLNPKTSRGGRGEGSQTKYEYISVRRRGVRAEVRVV